MVSAFYEKQKIVKGLLRKRKSRKFCVYSTPETDTKQKRYDNIIDKMIRLLKPPVSFWVVQTPSQTVSLMCNA